jgi:hypothetical protein
VLSAALFFCAAGAALLQPLVNSQTSPIRAPLFSPESGSAVLTALGLFIGLVATAILLAGLLTRSVAREQPVSPGVYALVVLLAPLYFMTFTLTKESTIVFELLLGSLGL